VINALTDSMTRAQSLVPARHRARGTQAVMGAKAAWFRLLEGDRMVLVQQIGLSATFLQERIFRPQG